jgi:hypothetical protein
MGKSIVVTSCDDCPFHWENMEYPESRCKAAQGSSYGLWGRGHHENGDPIPDKCPLKKGTVVVALVAL